MSAADGNAAVGDAGGDAAVDDADGDAGSSGTSSKNKSSKVSSSAGTGLNGGLIMVLTLAGLNVVLPPLVDGSGAGDDGLGGVCLVDAVGSFIPWQISCSPFKCFDAWSASSWLLKSSLRKIRLRLANALKALRFLSEILRTGSFSSDSKPDSKPSAPLWLENPSWINSEVSSRSSFGS